MRVLGVIPARGGSKGVLRKNLRLLGGRPLLAYTADAIREARLLTRVIVSTEDAEIAEASRALNLDVPFLRPQALAQDDTPTLPVIRHAVETLEGQNQFYDAICILQPTQPLRKGGEIDGCILMLENTQADSVVTVRSVPHEFNPHWVYFTQSSGFLRLSTGESQPIPRRQSLPPAVHRDGSVYLVRRDVLMIGNSLYGERVAGYSTDFRLAVNIDTEEDLRRAEELLREASHDAV
ncbi:MAG: acylneuraminate cytidylyltransferase family protein [Bryobacteraceae bacterium]|nr:acylneuraminate cytidylyltransferase family protein [Bryobacteraceae bacterium]